MFNILIEKRAEKFLKKLPIKSRRIIVEKILELKNNPFPGENKEKIFCPKPPEVYRLHISRSYTVFYIINIDDHLVKIEKIITIEGAHKDYFRR
ncbi:type II toxin-antitoxin system RelE family toxin [Methanolacinia petrolearia]|uniref:type II toxin-antitoxin system RelE family toxin n=1 Tax=Methanolacinia petrolearia TaxID=54120 RepID=UPI003BAA2ED3